MGRLQVQEPRCLRVETGNVIGSDRLKTGSVERQTDVYSGIPSFRRTDFLKVVNSDPRLAGAQACCPPASGEDER